MPLSRNSTTNRFALCAVLFLLPALRTRAQTATTSATVATAYGAITGTVVDSAKGAPIPFALVTAGFQPSAPVKGVATQMPSVPTRTARTDLKGTFTIPNLLPGTYEICTHAQEGQWLNPCLWNTTRPSAAVKAGETNTVAIQVDKGALVTLHVSDPGNNLAGANSAPGTEFVMGTRSTRGFVQRMPVLSKDAAGVTYQALVPASAVVRFAVLGSAYSLADGNGKAFGAATGDLIVTVPAGTDKMDVAVTVTGHQ